MKEQTLGITNEIAYFDMRNWYCKLLYDSPVATNRNVHAKFSSTLHCCDTKKYILINSSPNNQMKK